MNKQKAKLLTNLMATTIVTECIGFIGLTLYKIAEDLNLEKTKELGLLTWAITLIFALLSFTFLIIEYYKEKKQKNDKSKSQ